MHRKTLTSSDIYELPYFEKLLLLEEGMRLVVFAKDPHWEVRLAVALHGKYLKYLLNDSHWKVRMAVAAQSYGISKLIVDDHPDVRRKALEMAGIL